MQKTSSLNQPRLMGVKQTGKRIGKTGYQVLRLVASGDLEVELVDDHPKILISSIERLEAAAR
jgi:hypothetical protein